MGCNTLCHLTPASCLVVCVLVKQRILDSRPAGPWEYFRTRLTGAHVPDTRLVPSITHFRIGAFLRAIGIVALERLEALDAIQRSCVSNPLNRLPIRH